MGKSSTYGCVIWFAASRREDATAHGIRRGLCDPNEQTFGGSSPGIGSKSAEVCECCVEVDGPDVVLVGSKRSREMRALITNEGMSSGRTQREGPDPVLQPE